MIERKLFCLNVRLKINIPGVPKNVRLHAVNGHFLGHPVDTYCPSELILPVGKKWHFSNGYST